MAALVLYAPVLDQPGYLIGGGASTRVLAGGWLEVVLTLAIVGTAVALYPVTRRHNQGLVTSLDQHETPRISEAAAVA